MHGMKSYKKKIASENHLKRQRLLCMEETIFLLLQDYPMTSQSVILL